MKLNLFGKNRKARDAKKEKKAKKGKLSSKKEIKKKLQTKPFSRIIKFNKLNKANKAVLKRKVFNKMASDKDTSKIFMELFSSLSKNNIEIHFVNGRIVYKNKR